MFALQTTPPPPNIESVPDIQVVVTSPPASTGGDDNNDDDDAAPSHSWQSRQQHRLALDDVVHTALSSKRASNSKEWSRAAPPAIIRSRRSPGHVQVPARRSGRRSRASSITETEMRDLQRAFFAFQGSCEQEKSVRMCRSMETLEQESYINVNSIEEMQVNVSKKR